MLCSSFAHLSRFLASLLHRSGEHMETSMPKSLSQWHGSKALTGCHFKLMRNCLQQLAKFHLCTFSEFFLGVENPPPKWSHFESPKTECRVTVFEVSSQFFQSHPPRAPESSNLASTTCTWRSGAALSSKTTCHEKATKNQPTRGETVSPPKIGNQGTAWFKKYSKMRKVVNLYVENGGLSCRTGWIAGRNCQGSAFWKVEKFWCQSSWLVESKSSDYVSLTLKMMYEIWGPLFFMMFYPASALYVWKSNGSQHVCVRVFFSQKLSFCLCLNHSGFWPCSLMWVWLKLGIPKSTG